MIDQFTKATLAIIAISTAVLAGLAIGNVINPVHPGLQRVQLCNPSGQCAAIARPVDPEANGGAAVNGLVMYSGSPPGTPAPTVTPAR